MCLLSALCLLRGWCAIAAGESQATGLNGWLEAQKHFQTWSASFVQTRTLKALTDPLPPTKGHVWFAAPDRFRWELGEPPQTIAVRNEIELMVFYPRLKRVEKFPLNETGAWKDALSLLEAGFPRTEADVRARYDILSEESSGEEYKLVLQPKSSQSRKLVRQIAIRLDARNYHLLSTELVFADGSTMRNEFSDAELNPILQDDLFAPAIPADFKVVQPLKK